MARIDGSDRGALISVDSVRRLARALQKYEHGDRDIPGRKLRTAYDESSSTIRIGRTTAAWLKGETQEVELVYETNCSDEGSGSGSSGDTLLAYNLAFDVAEDRVVWLAEATNGCWYLIHAASCGEDDGSGSGDCRCPGIGGEDLTSIPGWDGEATQVLGHESGCLKWISTTDCEEGS